MIIIVQDALKDKNIESGYWSRQDKYSDYILHEEHWKHTQEMCLELLRLKLKH